MSTTAEKDFLERKKWTERSFEGGNPSFNSIANELKKIRATFDAGKASFSDKFRAEAESFIASSEKKFDALKLQEDAIDTCSSMRSKINFLKMDQKAGQFAKAESRFKEVKEKSEPLRGTEYAANDKVQAYLKEYNLLLKDFEASLDASKTSAEAENLSSHGRLLINQYLRTRDGTVYGQSQLDSSVAAFKEAQDIAAKFEADTKFKNDPDAKKFFDLWNTVKNDNITKWQQEAREQVSSMPTEADIQASIAAKGNSGLLHNHDSVKYKVIANYGNRTINTSVNASTKAVGFFEGDVTVTIEGVVKNLHISDKQGIEIKKGAASIVN